jgi:hypothetical protein
MCISLVVCHLYDGEQKIVRLATNGATAFCDILLSEGEDNLQSYLLLISEF